MYVNWELSPRNGFCNYQLFIYTTFVTDTFCRLIQVIPFISKHYDSSHVLKLIELNPQRI